MNHEKTENIRREFHQQNKLPSKLVKTSSSKWCTESGWTSDCRMHNLSQCYSLYWPSWKNGNAWKRQQFHVI